MTRGVNGAAAAAPPPRTTVPRALPILLLLGAAATVPLVLATVFPPFGALAILPTVALTLLLAGRFDRTGADRPWLVPALLAGGLLLAIVSAATGVWNGVSDEPYATPAFARAGLALYTRPVSFDYTQYGSVHHEFTYYVYLPLLTYLQVPGVDYRWLSIGAWVGSVLALRRDRYAASAVAMPWVALLAANGQNDFVPLLALSLALAPTRGRWAPVFEIIALGLKQFANAIAIGAHLLRREWRAALLASAVSLALLVPYLFVNAGAVYCRVLVANPSGGCSPASASFLLLKRNYWLYPTWIWAVFHRGLRQRAARVLARLRGSPEPI
ncbi:MAG TPA: hypothetical protein VGU43_01970 [Thermoplasmata archaeon]|nr:hypothetical protein [Thermoplasmata archaeon]